MHSDAGRTQAKVISGLALMSVCELSSTSQAVCTWGKILFTNALSKPPMVSNSRMIIARVMSRAYERQNVAPRASCYATREPDEWWI